MHFLVKRSSRKLDASTDWLIIVFTLPWWGEGPAGMSSEVNGHFGRHKNAALAGERCLKHPFPPWGRATACPRDC